LLVVDVHALANQGIQERDKYLVSQNGDEAVDEGDLDHRKGEQEIDFSQQNDDDGEREESDQRGDVESVTVFDLNNVAVSDAVDSGGGGGSGSTAPTGLAFADFGLRGLASDLTSTPSQRARLSNETSAFPNSKFNAKNPSSAVYSSSYLNTSYSQMSKGVLKPRNGSNARHLDTAGTDTVSYTKGRTERVRSQRQSAVADISTTDQDSDSVLNSPRVMYSHRPSFPSPRIDSMTPRSKADMRGSAIDSNYRIPPPRKPRSPPLSDSQSTHRPNEELVLPTEDESMLGQPPLTEAKAEPERSRRYQTRLVVVTPRDVDHVEIREHADDIDSKGNPATNKDTEANPAGNMDTGQNAGNYIDPDVSVYDSMPDSGRSVDSSSSSSNGRRNQLLFLRHLDEIMSQEEEEHARGLDTV
jgi:hypothetical protein